jgi:flagellar biosynthesis anti-sigma factor FlgM
MTDAINIHNRPTNTTTQADARTSTSAGGKESSAVSVTSSGQSNPSAVVDLSSSNLLKDIGEKIDQLPEVNEARVASIKQSLAQGEYQPDAEVIARKFSEIEKLLP